MRSTTRSGHLSFPASPPLRILDEVAEQHVLVAKIEPPARDHRMRPGVFVAAVWRVNPLTFAASGTLDSGLIAFGLPGVSKLLKSVTLVCQAIVSPQTPERPAGLLQ